MINISSSQSIFLGQFRFPVLSDFIPQAVNCSAGIAALLNFNAIESNKLQMAVEEAVKNVIDHYSTQISLNDFIDIHFKIIETALVISIFEKGIPFYEKQSNIFSLDRPYDAGLGMHMLNALMDKVEFFVHGRQGKETRLTKAVLLDQIPDSIGELYDTNRRIQMRKRVNDYSMRRSTKDDVSSIVRLAWKCYGYTQEDLLYDAVELEHLLLEEELISFIATNKEDGAVIGHLGLKYHNENVPEMGLAFVDPTYRCPGMITTLGMEAKRYAMEHGADGIFDCAVTTHTYSQKDLQEIGARPCSLMMGIAASGMQANMTGTSSQEKGTTINHYNVFNKKEEIVYPPQRHRDMISKIYGWMDLPRIYGDSSNSIAGDLSEVFLVPLSEALNVAFIIVNKIGKTTVSEIVSYMNECMLKKMDACYLFMSMQHPYSPNVVDECEKAGFSFCGVMPHIHNGDDRILLQKINVLLDTDSIRIFSDQSRELYQYILDQVLLD